MSVVHFQYLINGLCVLVMAAMKTHVQQEKSHPQGGTRTCCIRQSAQILPDRIPAALSVHFWAKIGQILDSHV